MKRVRRAQAQASTRRGASAGTLLVALLVTASLASSAQAQSVPLGTADSFAVLAGSTVTNTGPSVISGDLGVSPGTAVTGFPPGTVTAGTIHAADAVALQAQNDLTTAYNNAAGRSSTASVSGDLAGRTLTPGAYTSATSLGLSGDLTLDAQGNPNAVFVFQAGSTLTVGSGSRVLLIGGAQACNVFWQVGSSATIGTGAAFAGNILALTSISLTTAATLYGRALARNGAVTLDTNTVTRASCVTQTSTPPSATGTTATTGAGQPVTVVLHGTDPTGAPLNFVIISGPAHGTLGPINQSTGTVTYTPTPGYTGPDSFTYIVTSANGTSTPATGTITVTRARGGARPGAPSVTGPGNTTARLTIPNRGPRACVSRAFTAVVRGRNIARVDFRLNGRRVARVTRRDRSGAYRARIRLSRGSSSGRVTARVVFRSGTNARSRTLTLRVRRCGRGRAPARQGPSFTG